MSRGRQGVRATRICRSRRCRNVSGRTDRNGLVAMLSGELVGYVGWKPLRAKGSLHSRTGVVGTDRNLAKPRRSSFWVVLALLSSILKMVYLPVPLVVVAVGGAWAEESEGV